MGVTEIEVTVQSILQVDEPQGRYRLRVSPESTVEHLLKQICHEAGAATKSHYCLRGNGGSVLKLTDTLSQAGVQDGAFLHWAGETVKVKTSCHFDTFWILALGSFIIGAAGIIAICVVRSRNVDHVYDFAVVFDAGSSHSAMFIYKWEGSKLNGTAVAAQFGDKCTADGDGISDFENNPTEAGKSLQACINKAKAAIPSSKHSETPIYLGATAGMRLVNESNAPASEAIFVSIRETFEDSGFMVTNPITSARILKGSEEGAFSWITSNYLANVFKVSPPGVAPSPAQPIVENIGALDLGGASTQITFVPQDPNLPGDYGFTAPLFGRTYSLYTYSYLCYGVNEIRNRIYAALIKDYPNATEVEHPCLPVGANKTTVQSKDIFGSPCVSKALSKAEYDGYTSVLSYSFVGTSNSSVCQDLVNRTLFNTSVCKHSRCSFNNVYQPYVFGQFYAFSNFYYTTDFLNMSSSKNPTFDYTTFYKKKNEVCDSNWTQLQSFATSDPERKDLLNYCARSTYIDLLLHNGYGFNETVWKSLNFVRTVASTDIGWTLGFVLYESNTYAADYPEISMYTWTFACLMVLFCLFILVAVGLFIHGFRVRNRNSLDLQSQRDGMYGTI